jgi:sterol desaturase/sphingolipid hydroxylase (fatty acid hydroxylase superfamily)
VSPDLLRHINELGGRALALLVDPWVQPAFQGSVFWWPYLASAFVIALAGFWLARGGGPATAAAFFRRYFSRRIWAHPSAQADYAYYMVNSVLYPFMVAPLIVSGGWLAATIARGLDAALGAPPVPALGLAAWRVLYTILFFLAYDFGRFAAHSLMHDVPLLWQFHKVHHSAEVLTPFTNFRAHPVELFVLAAVPNLVTGLVSGVVWYLAAGEIGFYSFLGAHVLMLGFNAFANLRHSPAWISFGPRLNTWFVSPAHHQIHHSREARHFGKNRGFDLALWDRMFGTLYVPGAEEEFRLGLGDGTDGAWHAVSRLYFLPCRLALARWGLGRAPRPHAAAAGAEAESPGGG